MKRCQKLAGLEVDGIVGPKMREAVTSRKQALKVAARQREAAAKRAKPVIRPIGKGAAPKAMPTKSAGTKAMAAKVATAKAAAKKPAVARKAAPKETTIAGAAAGAIQAIVAAARKAAGKP